MVFVVYADASMFCTHFFLVLYFSSLFLGLGCSLLFFVGRLRVEGWRPAL